MSGPAGALLGLALSGIVAAGVGFEEASAACVGSFLLLCLSVRGENGPGFITTWISFVLLASLFIGLLVGGGDTVFLVTNAVLFLGVTGIYVVPQPSV